MKKILIPVVFCVLLAACQKNYTCECTSPGGVTSSYTVKDTKKNAKARCTDYVNNTYATNANNQTTCKIK